MDGSRSSFSFCAFFKGRSSCCVLYSSSVFWKLFSNFASFLERRECCLVSLFSCFCSLESCTEEISSKFFFSPSSLLKRSSCFCFALPILLVSSIPYFSRWKIRWSIMRRSLFLRCKNSLNCPWGRTTVRIKSSLVRPSKRIHSAVTSVGLSARTVSFSPSQTIRRPVVLRTVEVYVLLW